MADNLIDAQSYQGRRILVVGGGDSAIEAALGLADQPGNTVTLSYRKSSFSRLKARYESRIREAISTARLECLFCNHVLRVGGRAWQSPGPPVRFDFRADQWFDQDGKGTAWDVGMTLSDWPLDRHQLILGVYDTGGLSSSGPGGRVTWMRFFSKGFVSVGYDTGGFLYNPTSLLFRQQAVHLSADLTLTPTTSISLSGDYRLGNRQESLSGGMDLQKRF